MIKVLIADDHRIFLDGLRAILSTEKEISVEAEAISGDEVLKLLSLRSDIDIVVLDWEMIGKNGLDTAIEIRNNHPHVKILMLTMHDSGELIDKLFAVPVDGYILKLKGADQLVEAIYKLNDGRTHFSPEIHEELVRYRKSKTRNEEIKLTPREMEVLRLIAQENTTPKIAETLFIAQSTVETHRRNLIGKLGVKSTLGLVKWAVEHGIK
jgi:DNA-binding NarL/FixJ family response regulator